MLAQGANDRVADLFLKVHHFFLDIFLSFIESYNDETKLFVCVLQGVGVFQRSEFDAMLQSWRRKGPVQPISVHFHQILQKLLITKVFIADFLHFVV